MGFNANRLRFTLAQEGKLTRAKTHGKEGEKVASLFSSFLPFLDAPQTHRILPINHSANAEKRLGTSLEIHQSHPQT